MGSATHDWPGHVDSVWLLHTVFYKWRVLHLKKITFSGWLQQTLVLLKNSPARVPAKESNSEADPFLCLNDPQWYAVFESRFSDISFCQNVPAVTQQHLCLVKQRNCWMLGYLLEARLRICLRMRGLQMACVCIWVGRLSLSSIAETTANLNRLLNWSL